MTGKPVLYDYWRSSASYRLRIALNLKGIVHEVVPVSLIDRAHKSAEYLARNPQGFVPALAIDGATLTQSLAILQYLDTRDPEPRLFPGNPMRRAQVEAVAHAVAMDIHPVCNLSVASTVVDWVDGDEGARNATRLAWMQRFIVRGLDAVEALLPEPAPYAFGDAPTLADVCLMPQIYNARRWELDVARWPKLARVETACAQNDAFARAAPDAVKPG